MIRHFAIFLLTISTIVTQAQQYKASLLIPYRLKDKWGYADTLGNIRIQPAYDSVNFFPEQNPYSIVYQGSNKGLVDQQGNLLLNSYQEIERIYPYRFFIVKKKEHTGLFDALKKKLVIPLKYDKVSYFEDSLYQIEIKGKHGLAWQNGKVCVSPKYDDLHSTGFSSEYADAKGKVIASKGGHYFLVDLKTGKGEKIQGEYSDMMVRFEEPVEEKRSNGKELEESLSKEHELDSVKAIEILSIQYYSKVAYKTYKNNKVGLIVPNSFTLNPTYDDITAVADSRGRGVYIAAVRNNKAGIINNQEKIILPFIYDELTEFSPRMVKTRRNKMDGMLLFYTVYPPIDNLYESIELDRTLTVSRTWGFAIFKVKKDDKKGYVGENGVEYFKN